MTSLREAAAPSTLLQKSSHGHFDPHNPRPSREDYEDVADAHGMPLEKAS